MLIGAYSVSGYSKNERECETQVRQSTFLHGVHETSAICCLGTSGLQRSQYCI